MKTHYVLCIKNTGYEASLEPRKVYVVIEEDLPHGLIRVIDESDEDYLFPSEFFIPVSIPETAEKIFTVV